MSTPTSLTRTVRVTSSRSWLGINADLPHGTVIHDVEVPNAARNKTEDFRLVGAPDPVVHTRRFMPHGIPKGVDMGTSNPNRTGSDP